MSLGPKYEEVSRDEYPSDLSLSATCVHVSLRTPELTWIKKIQSHKYHSSLLQNTLNLANQQSSYTTLYAQGAGEPTTGTGHQPNEAQYQFVEPRAFRESSYWISTFISEPLTTFDQIRRSCQDCFTLCRPTARLRLRQLAYCMLFSFVGPKCNRVWLCDTDSYIDVTCTTISCSAYTFTFALRYYHTLALRYQQIYLLEQPRCLHLPSPLSCSVETWSSNITSM